MQRADKKKAAVTALQTATHRITMREKAMILAQAAKEWTTQQSSGQLDVAVFLPEPPVALAPAAGNVAEIFRVEDVVGGGLGADRAEGGGDDEASFSVPESAYMRRQVSRMVKVEENESES